MSEPTNLAQVPNDAEPPRRPLRSRGNPIITGLAARLARRGVRPNAISVVSMVFAGGAAACLAVLPGGSVAADTALLAGAIAGIQLRLLCNVLDGLVAIEGGLKSRTGVLFNEVPDRLADVVILVAAGYAIPAYSWAPELGWLCALLAVSTAYIRHVGGALGLPQWFMGPMAKQQRMALLTGGLAASIGETAWAGFEGRVLTATLVVVAVGTAYTFVRRLRRIAGEVPQ